MTTNEAHCQNVGNIKLGIDDEIPRAIYCTWRNAYEW